MKTFIRHIGRKHTKIDYNMTRQYNTIFYNIVDSTYSYLLQVAAKPTIAIKQQQ